MKVKMFAQEEGTCYFIIKKKEKHVLCGNWKKQY